MVGQLLTEDKVLSFYWKSGSCTTNVYFGADARHGIRDELKNFETFRFDFSIVIPRQTLQDIELTHDGALALLYSIRPLVKRFALVINTITKFCAGLWIFIARTSIYAFQQRIAHLLAALSIETPKQAKDPAMLPIVGRR